MIDIIAFILGLCCVVSGLIIKTRNIKSSIIAKVIPFVTGVYMCVYAVINMGIFTLNI